MASTRKGTDRHQTTPDAAMAGVPALVEARDSWVGDGKSAPKTEVPLLTMVSIHEIAALTGRRHDAFRNGIQRGTRK